MTTRALGTLLAVVAIAGLWMGCKEDPPASLYDPSYVSGAQPKVTGIVPASGALAGVTTLTINGQNFSAVAGDNLVFFDKTLAPVLTATSTALTVKAPNLPKDSIQVKVAVAKADLFSDVVLYKLNMAVIDKFPNFATGEEGFGVECDLAGNLYVSMTASGSGGIGVFRFTPAGVRSFYSKAFNSAVATWRAMKFGPGGALFTVAGRTIVFRVPAGGGDPAIWLSGSGLGVLYDLDFDANANLWASGPNGNIYRVKQDKTVKTFPFIGTVRTLRVFNNAVYVGGKRDSLEKVWKLPIVGTDSLGAEEEYFNFSSLYGANTYAVNAITFTADGDLLIGTDAAVGILAVHPGKTSEPLYSGLLNPTTAALTWDAGVFLFQSRSALPGPATSVKINMQKTGAPYYGRTLP
jgi:hypothetical protein